MKKLLLVLALGISIQSQAQCPPNAFAYLSPYITCPSGCGVLLVNWPEGVLVNIYGGAPIGIVSSVPIPGSFGGPGVGNAFTCVPCNMPLIFASAVPGATSGCVILNSGGIPIKLTRFEGRYVNNAVIINWEAENQNPTSSYMVERSTDGRSFSPIGQVITANGAPHGRYQYVDNTPPAGQVYYRLRSQDVGESTKYSSLLLVKTSDNASLTVYPNPFESSIALSVSANQLPATVTIQNAQGARVYTQIHRESAFRIEQSFPKGIYTLVVQPLRGGAPVIKKIVRQ